MTVVAVSFDDAETTRTWAHELGFGFTLASDVEGRVIDEYSLRNEWDLGPSIAYHAVYLIDPDGNIFYRKIARRRPRSDELLRALDRVPLRCCPGDCGETICTVDDGA